MFFCVKYAKTSYNVNATSYGVIDDVIAFLVYFKMTEDAEIVRLYYELGKSPTSVIRHLKKHYGCERLPSSSYSEQI